MYGLDNRFIVGLNAFESFDATKQTQFLAASIRGQWPTLKRYSRVMSLATDAYWPGRQSVERNRINCSALPRSPIAINDSPRPVPVRVRCDRCERETTCTFRFRAPGQIAAAARELVLRDRSRPAKATPIRARHRSELSRTGTNICISLARSMAFSTVNHDIPRIG